ncbi:TetR/AcrR family transcriptional regulator [Leptospira sp. 201903074]|uniref:TetR/AcrR family transcriptional regulator n=1 Tax=Leptospira abararensis TaxID=2810036 RepID=UPI0019644152|nr:TetR/AcrR family transcriptional regulator [Leptospira abararensis]MBM9547426.1 TetR/AcrR family transcriptional regulator [Leptospira abararensis]
MGRHKQFDRTEVIEKAMHVFWEKGFASSSLKDIEKATGVFKSGLYSEFEDKDDLFIQTIIHYKQTHPSRTVLREEPFGWGNIREFFRLVILSENQLGDYLARIIPEIGILPKKVRSIVEESATACGDDFVKNLKADGVKKDIQLALDFITTFYYGMTVKVKMEPAEKIEREIDRFIKLLQSSLK